MLSISIESFYTFADFVLIFDSVISVKGVTPLSNELHKDKI